MPVLSGKHCDEIEIVMALRRVLLVLVVLVSSEPLPASSKQVQQVEVGISDKHWQNARATHLTKEPHIGQTRDVDKEEVSLSHDIHMPVTKKEKNGKLTRKKDGMQSGQNFY